MFNENDYILFYANGPDSQTYSEGNEDFSYTKNPYSQKSYYFIKIDNTPGLRVLKRILLKVVIMFQHSVFQAFTMKKSYTIYLT